MMPTGKAASFRSSFRGIGNSVWNLNLILENDPDLQGFAFNDMANRIQVTGELPWERPEGNSLLAGCRHRTA